MLIFMVMLLPYAQVKLLKISMTPLTGVKDSLTKPEFTIGKFLDGSYQDSLIKYTSERAGFRPWLIRLKNQVDYSLFNYTISGGVVIGKEGCLFLNSYVNNYCGIDFLGTSQIDYEVKRLALVSRELKKKNVGFLLILAPGKATYEQEKIPGRFRKRHVTNYEYYASRLASSQIDFIDMNRWFRQMKGHLSYPLFPKKGVHWTSYGVGLAADSMVRYIEKMKNIDMPEIICDHVDLSDTIKLTDNDAGDLMNLFCLAGKESMPYPEFRYNKEGKFRPNVVVIADSYWWGFITSGISWNVFGKTRYWFYNKDIYEEEQKIGTVAGTNIRQELERQDLVIMLISEATWMLFPFGFTEAFMQDYQPRTDADREVQLGLMIEKIRNDPEWYRSIEDKAAKNRVSVEEQLRRDAEYMVEQANNNKKP